jgi:hypothetical protein
MKILNLFTTITFLIMVSVSAALFNGCDHVMNDNPVSPPSTNGVVARATVYNMDVIIGGRVPVPAGTLVAFDDSKSIGTITRQLWKFYHNGVLSDTNENKTFLKSFTQAPDSFYVVLKVWGLLASDTSSTNFTLLVGVGTPGASEPYIESSTLMANGKRVNVVILPMSFIPVGPFNDPTIYGGPHLIWSGVSIFCDSSGLNHAYRTRDTLYNNGGYDISWSGVRNGPWALPGNSFLKDPNNPTLFWFDEREGVLNGYGQPALIAPGSVGDTSYLNGILRASFTSTTVNLFMNNRTGNCPLSSVPTYQYSTAVVLWTTVNQNIINSSGWGQGNPLISNIGSDNLLKVRVGNNVNNSLSIFWVPSEQACVMVIIQPMRLILSLTEASKLGYSNPTINALLAANPGLK